MKMNFFTKMMERANDKERDQIFAKLRGDLIDGYIGVRLSDAVTPMLGTPVLASWVRSANLSYRHAVGHEIMIVTNQDGKGLALIDHRRVRPTDDLSSMLLAVRRAQMIKQIATALERFATQTARERT